MFNLSGRGGHMCDSGRWNPIPSLLCSRCRYPQETYGPPTTLDHCTKCHSRWITDGKCDKCGTEMKWLKTDRSYYQFHKRLK